MSKPTSWVRFLPGNTFQYTQAVDKYHIFYSLLLFSVFKELVARVAEERKNGVPHLPKIGDGKKNSRYSVPELGAGSDVIGQEKVSKKVKAHTVGGRNKLMKILDKTRMSILPQKPYRYTSTQTLLLTLLLTLRILKEKEHQYESCHLSDIFINRKALFHIHCFRRMC